jgi:hypothetical protein
MKDIKQIILQKDYLKVKRKIEEIDIEAKGYVTI